jgi:hypothetical protein
MASRTVNLWKVKYRPEPFFGESLDKLSAAVEMEFSDRTKFDREHNLVCSLEIGVK